MNKITAKFLIGILLFLALANAASVRAVTDPEDPASVISSLQTSGNSIQFTIIVPWDNFQIGQKVLDGKTYTTLALADWPILASPGEPALPFFNTAVGAPIGAQVSLKINPGKETVISIVNPVLPAPTQKMPWDDTADMDFTNPLPLPEQSIQPDENIYNQDKAYPGDLGQIASDGQVRQQRVLGISLYPVQYNPSKGQLVVYETLQVELTFDDDFSIQSKRIKPDSAPFEALLQQTLINYQQALGWRQPAGEIPAALEQTNQTEIFPTWTLPNPAWRIALREEGIYQLTYDQLAAADFPVSSVDPSHVQLFSLGDEVALQFDGNDDSTFESGESFYFYGQAVDNKYTGDNIYWLTTNASGGERMSPRDVTPGGETTPASYRDVKTFEENHYYLTAVPGSDDLERFMWEYIYPTSPNVAKSWSHTFQMTAPAGSDALLLVFLLGYSSSSSINPDHHIVIYFNNNLIGEKWWDGATLETLDLTVPAGYINNGANAIKVVCPNDTGVARELVYVDKFELTFDRGFQAQENQLFFSYDQPGTWLYQINDFTSTPQALYDVSDPTQVEQLVGFNADSTYLQFTDTLSEKASYWAIGNGAVKSVDSIISDVPSDLQAVTNIADYILITPDEFWTQAGILTSYRESQGLAVEQVRLQDIYDEFNYGIADANAIHDFLHYAYENWQDPAPSYVLLLGDGHYDPKNYLGYGRQSFIPPFLGVVDPWIGETASDNRYVTLSGTDTMHDMMIGRLAVNTAVEAENFINKIIDYEEYPAPSDWNKSILAVADNQDSGGDFPSHSDSIINDHIPDAYQVERVYLYVTHYTADSVRTAIINHINTGKLFVQYVGHASYTAWAEENLFSSSSVNALTNENKFPIFLPMTCYDGFFHRPHALESNQEAVGEVVTRADGRGAVASWSPTGLGISSGHDFLISGFYDAVFKDRFGSLGEAASAGKLNLWISGANLDLLDTYTLFGDPTTAFPLSFQAAGDAYDVYEDETLQVSSTNGVLVNDFHPSSAVLTAILVEDVSHGELNLASDGSFLYTPESDYFGFDSFKYKASDGNEESNTVSVSIRIYSVNDPPVAHDQNLSTGINTPINITLRATDDGGYSPPDSAPNQPMLSGLETITNDGLIYEVLTQPTHGTLSGTAPDLIYTPGTDFIGTDQFTFTASDGVFTSNDGLITIQVIGAFYYFIPIVTH